ncbi:MAG: ATP-binding cassette domain-containing protein [Flavobacteriaceae bacterium]
MNLEPPLLCISNLTRTYSDKKVLQDIELKLYPGEIVGFLGPNGAGKTTLMKILSGYDQNWQGDIRFQDLDLKTQRKQIQAHTGYLPEHNPLYKDWYVLEYLQFIAALYGIKHPALGQVIEQTGLSGYSHAKIKTLSKGYRQRVGIAASIIHDPEFIILDEPTTGLDPNQLVEIRHLIRNLGASKTILLSTHILQEVDALCDRVIVLHQGKIVLDDRLENLRQRETQIIEVAFDYRVETVALEQITGIDQVKNTFDFEYEIHASGPKDLRPVLFDFAHDNGLKIVKLQRKSQQLEQLFERLTQD